MAKTKSKTNKKLKEADSTYFLKLVLYVILGTQWVRLANPELTTQIPLPVGLLVGMFFASHEHFQIDRKIEYAVLLVATFIGFWFQSGIIMYVL